jgi:hypothetical protein
VPSLLKGYRRTGEGRFVPWLWDEQGHLWSDVLGLYLVPRGMFLQAATPDGVLLPTPDQVHETRLLEGRRAEEAQRQAEAEIRRLHEEIARLRGQDNDSSRPPL